MATGITNEDIPPNESGGVRTGRQEVVECHNSTSREIPEGHYVRLRIDGAAVSIVKDRGRDKA
jgi:hypothetical protein